MFEKFSRSWELIKASASVLRADKELMLYPILSSIAALLVMATFAVPMFALKLFDNGFNAMSAVLGFLFYFCQYSIIVFFNSALVAAATIRLEGGDPTFADGIRAAKARLPAILGYAAIAATVGLILQSLKDRDNNFIVRLIGSGLGVAWTLATFLVVPVLVNRNIGPVDALKESLALLRRTWGENAIGNVGIGAVFGAIMVAVIVIGGVTCFFAAQASVTLAITLGVVFVLAAVVLGVIQSALSGIYSAALYRYATAHETPDAFRGMALESAFAPKR
jgi:ABC-type multidrug transport system fused ATPase/permease subunit